jgi:hypothetical protein
LAKGKKKKKKRKKNEFYCLWRLTYAEAKLETFQAEFEKSFGTQLKRFL